MSHFYTKWNFSKPPFEGRPLDASDTGLNLLVGRSRELKDLKACLSSGTRVAVVQGQVGMGKTSLTNVAAFSLLQERLAGREADAPLFIPCQGIFNIEQYEDFGSFKKEVEKRLVLTLDEASRKNWFATTRNRVDARRLAEPYRDKTTTTSVSVSAGGVGVGVGGTLNPNSDWLNIELAKQLSNAFGDGGGIVCLIDNVEKLRDSPNARQILDASRDSLFVAPGVRWVLCGAPGVREGLAHIPRLDRFLQEAIEIDSIDDYAAEDVIRKRVEVFGSRDCETYLPFRPQDFAKLHSVLQGNLGDALARIDRYCTSSFAPPIARSPEGRTTAKTEIEKGIAFEKWLAASCKKEFDERRGYVTDEMWATFKRVIFLRGSFTSDDYWNFYFDNKEDFVTQCARLMRAGLVADVLGNTDSRTANLQVTSPGLLVAEYFRKRGDKIDASVGVPPETNRAPDRIGP